MNLRVWLIILLSLGVCGAPCFEEASHAETSTSESASSKRSRKGGKSKKRRKKKRIYHEVKRGETVGKIAKKYDVRVKDIVRWNDLEDAGKIRRGQKLLIKVYVTSSSSSRSSSSGSKMKKVYVVRKGDSLSEIAAKKKQSIKDLKKWNRKLRKNPDLLRVGQKIVYWVPGPSGSSSVGKVNSGSLSGSVKLSKGKGYFRKQPKYCYGTARTVSLIEEVFGAFHKKHPKAPEVVVGDISSKKGGKLKKHLSHQTGRDVDIGYLHKDGEALRGFVNMSRKNLDVAKSWALIKTFLDTDQVEYIFIDYKIQKLLYKHAKKKGMGKSELARIFQYPRGRKDRTAIIRHVRGHKHHFHVRFTCPANDKHCK